MYDYPKYETLLTEIVEPNIMLVTLNRPKAYNALSHQMFLDLENLFKHLKRDLDVRVVLLYGGDESKGFCAGLDVKEGLTDFEKTAPGFYDYQIAICDAVAEMVKIPQPVITLIDNVAGGAGFSLAMCSDIRVCTETARFSCFYANVGIGGADMTSSYMLPRLIGTGRAYEFLLTGDFFSAQEADKLGLVSRIVPTRADLLPTAMQIARTIAAKDPLAVRLTKEAMRLNVDAPGLENALQVENRNQTLMICHNMDKDPTLPPIGKHWIEQR